MIRIVTRKVYLRPTRSPSRPNTSAPNGTHQEAGGECQQREDVAGGFIELAEELRADDDRERAIKIEIIPLEHGTEGRSEDDFHLVPRHRANRGCHHVRRRRGCTHLEIAPFCYISTIMLEWRLSAPYPDDADQQKLTGGLSPSPGSIPAIDDNLGETGRDLRRARGAGPASGARSQPLPVRTFRALQITPQRTVTAPHRKPIFC